MSTTTLALSFEQHLSVATDRVTFDLSDADDRPRYFDALAEAEKTHTFWARSSTIPTRVRVIARTFHWAWFAATMVVFAVFVRACQASPDPTLRSVMLGAVTLGVIIAWFATATATDQWRGQATLPLRDRRRRREEKYRHVMRERARTTVARAAKTNPAAAQVLTDLDAMTDAIEDLVRERARLQQALDAHRYASTYVIDEDDTRARLAEVLASLTHVTAVHMAAAAAVTTRPSPAARTDHTDPVRPVPTHLDPRHQADLAAAIARVGATIDQMA